ncbi:hypothetical protein SprV_0702265700 [Sparganum proliferum]
MMVGTKDIIEVANVDSRYLASSSSSSSSFSSSSPPAPLIVNGPVTAPSRSTTPAGSAKIGFLLKGRVYLAPNRPAEWQSDYENNTSPAFTSLATNLCRSLVSSNAAGSYIVLSTAPMRCQVLQLYPGSVYSEALITYHVPITVANEVHSSDALNSLQYGAIVSGNTGMLNDGTSIQAVMAPCPVCEENAKCVRGLSTSTCECQRFYVDALDTPSGTHCQLSAGGIALITVATMAAVCILLLICGCCKVLSNRTKDFG